MAARDRRCLRQGFQPLLWLALVPGQVGATSDFYVIEISEPEQGLAKLIEVITNRIPRRFGLNPLKDVQVLCPMIRGVLGARNLNHELQRVLNPNTSATVERFGWRFSPGDRVMETQNDYDRDVFNGDLGTVARIYDEEGTLVVNFEGREVVYPFGELDTLIPAFATTIHKSQGSEYPAVVIPVTTQHYAMLGDLCRALMKYRPGHGEERFSERSAEYCRRARAHLASIGSPLATAPVPSVNFVPSLASAPGQVRVRVPAPSLASGPGRVRVAGRSARVANAAIRRAQSRQLWAAHDARMKAILSKVSSASLRIATGL